MIGFALPIGQTGGVSVDLVFTGNRFGEFVQKPCLAYPVVGDDGEGLTTTPFRPLKTVKQKLKFAFPSHKGCQSPLDVHFEPGVHRSRRYGSVYLERILFALDRSLSQGLESEKALRSHEDFGRRVGSTRLRYLLHPLCQNDRVADHFELGPEIVPQGTEDN